MKIKNYKEFSEPINESFKDIILGSLLTISSLIPHNSQASDQADHVIRKGMGGVKSNFDRHRELVYTKGKLTSGGDYTRTHTSSKNYSNLYNKLLNDLDSLEIQDPILLSVKNKLMFSDQTSDLDLVDLTQQLYKVAQTNNQREIMTILENIEKYSSQDLRDLSKSDTSKIRSQFEMVVADLNDLLNDEEPFTDTTFFKWVLRPMLVIAAIILLLMILSKIGENVTNWREQRAIEREEQEVEQNRNRINL